MTLPDINHNLLLIGASARAAAQSAVRADVMPVAIDLFADADLRRTCHAIQVHDYPAGFVAASQTIPPMDWMYLGGLENRPRVVESISARHRLVGNDSTVLNRVRNPCSVARQLRECHLPCPEVRPLGSTEIEGRWLRKTNRSAGGGGVAFWHRGADIGRNDGNTYLQQFIEGDSVAANFVASRGKATLLGVTRQLVGANWTGASGFRYAGSIGPLVSENVSNQFSAIGDCLTRRFGLRGLFGVDAIHASGVVWPVEINPRYTASIEVLERAFGVRAIQLHLDACADRGLPALSPNAIKTYCGKAIIYSARDVSIDNRIEPLADQIDPIDGWPSHADIPRAGSVIRAKHPVATILAAGTDVAMVERKLRSLATKLQDVIYRS